MLGSAFAAYVSLTLCRFLMVYFIQDALTYRYAENEIGRALVDEVDVGDSCRMQICSQLVFSICRILVNAVKSERHATYVYTVDEVSVRNMPRICGIFRALTSFAAYLSVAHLGQFSVYNSWL